MAENEERERLLGEVEDIEREIDFLELKINGPLKTYSYIETASTSLPARIKSIRDRGYVFKAYIDRQASEIFNKWSIVRDSYKTKIDDISRSYRFRFARLKDRCDSVRRDIERGYEPYSQISMLKSEVGRLRQTIETSVENINSSLRKIAEVIRNIETEVSVAERALDEISKASFKLFEDENIVECFDAKLMDKKKRKGIIYFTDKRFLFEGFKEVVLEKKFFIVTKKKTVRELLIDVPIGYIDNISKGKVGFLARGGIYINFKEGPYRQLVFDLKDRIIPRVIKTFNYIVSGQIDRDKVIREKVEEEKRMPIVMRCPMCGAPIEREIFRGEETIRCEYCGAAIRL